MHDDGGFSIVSKNNKWGKITFRLGYSDGSSLGNVLQQHYEKILFPYDVFLTKLRDAKVKIWMTFVSNNFQYGACQPFMDCLKCFITSQLMPCHLSHFNSWTFEYFCCGCCKIGNSIMMPTLLKCNKLSSHWCHERGNYKVGYQWMCYYAKILNYLPCCQYSLLWQFTMEWPTVCVMTGTGKLHFTAKLLKGQMY